jgi:hypothetical protein
MRWIRHAVWLLAVLVAAACGGDDDAGADAGGTDADVAAGCAPVLDTTFDLDATGLATQIHASVAFDGDALWLAYNAPDDLGTGGFDVFLSRIACNGTRLLDPIPVSTNANSNDVDPTVVLGDDRVYVVWAADNGTGIDNMDILYRVFDRDGAPIMASNRILETTRDGDPVTGNAMFPTVTALPDGGFAIAGVRGLEETGTFQAFVQRMDASGEPVGAAFDGYFEVGVTQTSPAVAASSDGAMHIAWERSEAVDEDYVVRGRVAANDTTVAPSPPPTVGVGEAASPNLAIGHEGNVYLSYVAPSTGDLVIEDGADLGDSPPSATFGGLGRLDHSPVVATDVGGGAVAYHRNISGFRNEVIVQAFSYDGAEFVVDAEVSAAAEAPPYAPAFAAIGDRVYFVAWSEGTSPAFYLKGRFIRL